MPHIVSDWQKADTEAVNCTNVTSVLKANTSFVQMFISKIDNPQAQCPETRFCSKKSLIQQLH